MQAGFTGSSNIVLVVLISVPACFQQCLSLLCSARVVLYCCCLFRKAAGFCFLLFFQPHSSYALSPCLHFPCSETGQLVLVPECPALPFPSCPALIAERWCLTGRTKRCIISRPPFPSSVFNFCTWSACWLWAPGTWRRGRASCSSPWSPGEGSGRAGCHSEAAHLCRNACSEQNKACTNSYHFSKEECHSFLKIYIILQDSATPLHKNCLPSDGWRGQGMESMCISKLHGTAASPPECCSSAVQLPHSIPFASIPWARTSGSTKGKIVGSKCCWENVKDWQDTERCCWLKKDLEGLK